MVKEATNKRTSMVMDEVESAIERCVQESDLTFAEVLGSLELVKARLLEKYLNRNCR